MSETEFKAILEQVCAAKFSLPEDAPEHRFSYRHKRNMKRILSAANSAPNVVTEHRTAQKRSLKRTLLIAAVLAFLAVIVGAVVVFRSEDFRGTVYHDYTKMFSANIEGSPKTIEYKYALDYVPEGFEIVETDLSPISVYTLYMNKSTKQTIALSQWVKENFEPHYNTEHRSLEEVIINDSTGLCIDFSHDDYKSTVVAWDIGDYIIQIDANLDKESALYLCKVHKLYEIEIVMFPNCCKKQMYIIEGQKTSKN